MEPNIYTGSIQKFLDNCALSSGHAYEAFKQLLAELWDETSRRESRVFLESLFSHLKQNAMLEGLMATHGFTFNEITVAMSREEDKTLRLLQLPSIFAPEEWSFTFLEGLSRYSNTEFEGKRMTELGSGNGWIALAIAIKARPAKIYGLDINPRARICGGINLFLAATDADGHLITDGEGKSLLDRVEYHTSDLLGYCIENNITLDCVIGCIPQVLSPDEEILSSIIPETASDDYLHSLSNYCGKQGYVEDQFGLGLIARTLEESVDMLAPGGKIILNMGGRPGSTVLDRLFHRRGFSVKKVWRRKIQQAADTEIATLVDIEKVSQHRFEFFIGRNSDEPISASTAQKYVTAGGDIYHALTVYESGLGYPGKIKRIFNLLKNPGYVQAKSALDLYFEDASLAEEKIGYLAALAKLLEESLFFPYEQTAGSGLLRKRFAEYLNSYFYVPIAGDNIVVAPNTGSLVKNILSAYRPKLALLSRKFLKHAPGGVACLEAPSDAFVLGQLIAMLKPEIAAVGLADFQYRSPDAFARLVETAAAAGTRLFIDISEVLDLSSSPEGNGVLQYIAATPLPLHVGVICSLERNKVYEDLQLGILISENEDLLSSVIASAEYTYSRSPMLTQHYYSELIYELLKFQIGGADRFGAARKMQNENADFLAGFVNVQTSALMAFAHPCLEANSLPLHENTVRLDYGENELSSPEQIKADLFEAFARQHIGPAEYDVNQVVKAFIGSRIGIDPEKKAFLKCGNGVAPIFSAMMETCALEGGTAVFPKGTYSFFYATAQFYGITVKEIETLPSDAFKMTPGGLEAGLAGVTKGWLFLNAPIVNPTGVIYSPSEAEDLLDVAAKHDARVIVDMVFSGLEHGDSQRGYDLDKYFDRPDFSVVAVGGASKEFAAGGLRFGFAYTRNAAMQEVLEKGLVVEPHFTVKFACKKIYQGLSENSSTLNAQLKTQRDRLKDRAERLSSVLTETGWEFIRPEGGLFMVAKPTGYLGKRFVWGSGQDKKEWLIDSVNISDALFYANGLLINNSYWTGIPGYCRFVLSVQDTDFEKALTALREFKKTMGA